jgi:hypothetical protein
LVHGRAPGGGPRRGRRPPGGARQRAGHVGRGRGVRDRPCPPACSGPAPAKVHRHVPQRSRRPLRAGRGDLEDRPPSVIVCDTGLLVGSMDADDAHHEDCTGVFAKYGDELVVPLSVVIETCGLHCRPPPPHRRLHPAALTPAVPSPAPPAGVRNYPGRESFVPATAGPEPAGRSRIRLCDERAWASWSFRGGHRAVQHAGIADPPRAAGGLPGDRRGEHRCRRPSGSQRGRTVRACFDDDVDALADSQPVRWSATAPASRSPTRCCRSTWPPSAAPRDHRRAIGWCFW